MNKRVLIVEDDDDLRRGLSLRLADSGYDVVQATDGVEAISVAAREHPDVVLLDLGLPDGDGLTVLERYASQPGLSGIPVVVLTGRNPLTAEPAVQKFHVLAFLRKPVENQQLLDALERALRGESTPPAYAAIAPSTWNG
jgi:two-component system KDP operon response regulator KdpE